MQSGPNSTQMILEHLKSVLDSDQAAIDVMAITLADFEAITHDFHALFSRVNFEHLSRSQKIESVWLYLSFSLSVHDRAYEVDAVSGNEKKNLIQRMDLHAYPQISYVLNDLNHYVEYSDHEKRPRGYHQKLLQINSNLFLFAHHLQEGGLNMENILTRFPLSLHPSLLKISRSICMDRHSDFISPAEKEINDILSNELKKIPQFKPKKALDSVEGQIYIDPIMGLELDYPIGTISIETDGYHHFTSPSLKPTLQHAIKELQMIEEGWTRVGIAHPSRPQAKVLAHEIGRTFHVHHVKHFIEKYDELMALRTEVRKEIIKTQNKMNNPKLTREKYNSHLNYAMNLLTIEKKIRRQTMSRHLANTLSKPCTPESQHALESYNLALTLLDNSDRIKFDTDPAIQEWSNQAEILGAVNSEILSHSENLSTYILPGLIMLYEKKEKVMTSEIQDEDVLKEIDKQLSEMEEIKSSTEENMSLLQAESERLNSEIEFLSKNVKEKLALQNSTINTCTDALSLTENYFNAQLPCNEIKGTLRTCRKEFEQASNTHDAIFATKVSGYQPSFARFQSAKSSASSSAVSSGSNSRQLKRERDQAPLRA